MAAAMMRQSVRSVDARVQAVGSKSVSTPMVSRAVSSRSTIAIERSALVATPSAVQVSEQAAHELSRQMVCVVNRSRFGIFNCRSHFCFWVHLTIRFRQLSCKGGFRHLALMDACHCL